MPRRGENIYKRKDNRWEGRLPIGKENGKTKYRSVYADSYSKLKEKMELIRKNGIVVNKSNDYTFGYFADQWLQSVKFRCKQSTYSKYFNICKCHVNKFFGNIKIRTLCNNDINNFLGSISELEAKTRNDILCVVKMIHSYAMTFGCCSNVRMDLICVRIPHKQMRVLSVEEQTMFSNYLMTNMNLFKLATYLVLCTGIRIGELCALKRKNISFKNNLIHIGATMQRIQTDETEKKTTVTVTEPKSLCSVRDIPITDPLASFLKNYCFDMPDDAYILTGDSVHFVEPAMIRYHFGKQLKDCGLENVTFHTLRHSFATRCVEAGVDIKTLSEILGHENVNITLNRYVHSSMDLKRESMEKLSHSTAYSPSI